MHRGAPGSGGPKWTRNGNYKHGRYTAELMDSRRWLRETTREVRRKRPANLSITHNFCRKRAQFDVGEA